ncbi:aminopeptidase N [Aliidiomarina taiwanensis]|uniref:Aminopeptidase N n=1 Tax=Aliidiomarina taiwanensis TaxID=946228 RepID=A0A432X9M8_9GAMM|nr:aminopeptidase N [Aliidiomarina taiwanensis]RUO44122.1 aminopeptidase N [Aliidiomarina taiwanensis]
MTVTTAPTARYRKDYKAPSFSIDTVDLHFYLDDTCTRVVNTMQVQKRDDEPDLVLDGEQLQLVQVTLDDRLLVAEQDYKVGRKSLTIYNVPAQFSLTIENTINPSANTALEGLYKSAGVFCSQCEAEGFRRITYFLDRPDVLSVYTTTLYVANKEEYPHLLSNGNKVDTGTTAEGLSWVRWHDPYPKPSYLFAVVAGDFDLLEDTYTTAEGRQVLLQFFVDKGNLNKAYFAMEALKNSMRWDEQRFGLSYDLDIYMVVAVDFFNMGAMENKGLNVFNSKFVLADEASATDQDFINVEAVIGHEYFHNWTGNRITCRDWFQLSLKEGLTVFREQEFSADQGMRAVNRIQDVRIMRTHQFEEDAGPMAHAIRPDIVVEMNNFYTVTIYNKGAEVVRMLHTLLGEQTFQAGMRRYIADNDGKAATCNDFLQAMEQASGRNLNQFKRWYSQAGTPEISVQTDYSRRQRKLTVTISQASDKPANAPFHIPIQVELLSQQGEPLHPPELPVNSVLELTEPEQTFTFTGLKEAPVFAPLANFSAPVKCNDTRSLDELITITRFAQDAFLRWDAVQQLYSQAVHEAIAQGGALTLPNALIDGLKASLTDGNSDPALVALLLQIPSEEGVAAEFKYVPVSAIHRAITELHEALARGLYTELLQAWDMHWPQATDKQAAFSKEAIAARMLCNTCLGYLAAMTDSEAVHERLQRQFAAEQSMTLVFGALQAAVHNQHRLAEVQLAQFANRWQHDPLVMDKWLAVQATVRHASSIAKVHELTEHSAFDWSNPNRVYALLASFSHNFAQLHQADGAGYALLVSAIKRLNTANPQVASRLLSPLLNWRRFNDARQGLLQQVLSDLRNMPDLAPDLFEKIEQSLR